MSTANSPTYAQGREDGLADTERVRNGLGADGPQPPFPAYPFMYLKGYEETFNPMPTEEAS